MTFLPLNLVIAFIAGISIIIAVMSLLILRFTLTRCLKKKLKASDEYWETGTLDFGFLNTYVFAYACTLPFVPRSTNYQALYKDLDVKAFATVFEKGTAYAMVLGFAVFFLNIPIFFLHEALQR